MALCRFRLGLHDLEINRGAWNKIPREERLCPLCQRKTVHSVEDESHFFLACPSFTALRQEYTDIFRNHLLQDQGGEQLQIVAALINNDQHFKRTGEFISSALTARKELLRLLDTESDQEDLEDDNMNVDS
jgi:hypothetical protein